MASAGAESPAPIRFILLGGFLGAGKTTMLARLARHYQAAGRNVAIVTNDKAAESVDTLRLRAEGLHVGELPGACFCGNVDELIDMVDALGTVSRPDVVLAEPVGSCLDMTATVIRPLEQAYRRRFDVAPYGVLLKPTHAARILRGDDAAGVSPQAAYIFRTQLQEADFTAINRCDQLSPEAVDELRQLIEAACPGRPVVAVSAATGLGFESLVAELERSGPTDRRVVPIDYDDYAAGEAELAWLNGTLLVAAAAPIDVDRFVGELLTRIRDGLRDAGAEIAHVKAVALGSGRHAAANVIGNVAPVETTHAAEARLAQFQLVLNARTACDPATLEAQIDRALNETARLHGAMIETVTRHAFRPGNPSRPPLEYRLM